MPLYVRATSSDERPASPGDGGERPRETGPLRLVRRHPVASFFLLAYALSWSWWVPDASLAGIPVVILTAHPGARDRATAMGAAGCLHKPVELAELIETVEHTRARV